MALPKRERVFHDPQPEDMKKTYLYSVIGALSALAGTSFMAWWAVGFNLEPWQWWMVIISPMMGSAAMVFMMEEKGGLLQ